MNFAHPEKLLWLLALLLVIGSVWMVYKNVLHRLSAFSGQKILIANQRRLIIRRGVLLVAVLVLLIVAWAEPRWGYHWQEVKSRGASVFIALDLSKSMYAQDLSPSRLERAKRKILDLLGMMKADRVGLIAFAGTALVQCPLTNDYEVIKLFLDSMQPENMPVQGTSFSAVIDIAADTLKQVNLEGPQVLVVLSDGESHDPTVDSAIKRAKEVGLKIYSIGVGTLEGAPIPDERAGAGFKKDDQGNMVVSKLQESLLKKIAEETGGLYQRIAVSDQDINAIYFRGARSELGETAFDAGRKQIPIDRSAFFAVVAVVLMGLQALLGARPQILLLLVGVYVTAHSQSLHAMDLHEGKDLYEKGEYEKARDAFRTYERKNQKDLSATYNRGVSSYRLGDYKDAAEAFAKAAEASDKDLAARSYYNLGSAEAKLDNLDGAEAALQEAVKLKPDEKKYLENLQALKQKKEEQKQQQQQQNQNDQDQKQDQKEKQGEGQKPQEEKTQDQKNAQQSKEQDQGADAKKDQLSEEKSSAASPDQQEKKEQKQDAKVTDQKPQKSAEQIQKELDADRLLKKPQDHAAEMYHQPKNESPRDQGITPQGKDW